MSNRNANTALVTREDAAELLCLSLNSLNTLIRNEVFAVIQFRNIVFRLPQGKCYLLREEIEAYAIGGAVAIEKLRARARPVDIFAPAWNEQTALAVRRSYSYSLADASAKSAQDIQALSQLCESEDVSGVERWIASGKPVNLPRMHKQEDVSPLQIALDQNNTPIVKMLLGAGAQIDHHPRWGSLSRAIRNRNCDLVCALVDLGGADPLSIAPWRVFQTRDIAIVQFFVERGLNLEEGNPLAHAYCERMYFARSVRLAYQHLCHSFTEQVAIGLRYHVVMNDRYWIDRMLKFNADPYSRGAVFHDQLVSEKAAGYSAIELAVLVGNFDLLSRVDLDARHPTVSMAMILAHGQRGRELLVSLKGRGLKLNDRKNGSSTILQRKLETIAEKGCKISGLEDTPARTPDPWQSMTTITALVEAGAKWIPLNADEIESARRAFLAIDPRCTVDLIAALSQSRYHYMDVIKSFLNEQLQSHTRKYSRAIQKLLTDRDQK